MVPKINRKNKMFKQKKLNGNLHAKQNRKETSINFLDTYTHMPKRAYDHKFTKLSYVHTNITKLKLNIRHYYVMKKRASTFFVTFFHSTMSPRLSPIHKMENLKTIFKKQQKTIMTINLCLFHSLNVFVFCQSCHSVQENWV